MSWNIHSCIFCIDAPATMLQGHAYGVLGIIKQLLFLLNSQVCLKTYSGKGLFLFHQTWSDLCIWKHMCIVFGRGVLMFCSSLHIVSAAFCILQLFLCDCGLLFDLPSELIIKFRMTKSISYGSIKISLAYYWIIEKLIYIYNI